MAHHTESRIILLPHSQRGRALDGDSLIADTLNAIELCERGYPQGPDLHKELPQADVDMSKLSVFSIVTYSPLKGDKGYYSFADIAAYAAGSYKRPIGEMKAIAGQLAFDAKKVAELVE